MNDIPIVCRRPIELSTLLPRLVSPKHKQGRVRSSLRRFPLYQFATIHFPERCCAGLFQPLSQEVAHDDRRRRAQMNRPSVIPWLTLFRCAPAHWRRQRSIGRTSMLLRLICSFAISLFDIQICMGMIVVCGFIGSLLGIQPNGRETKTNGI